MSEDDRGWGQMREQVGAQQFFLKWQGRGERRKGWVNGICDTRDSEFSHAGMSVLTYKPLQKKQY